MTAPEPTPCTPTDEVVKDAACFPRKRLGEPRGVEPADFDRWLARVRAEARRDAFNEAADEVHVEARWAGETQRRGLHAYYRPEERLLMVERILRACAAAETPNGGA